MSQLSCNGQNRYWLYDLQPPGGLILSHGYGCVVKSQQGGKVRSLAGRSRQPVLLLIFLLFVFFAEAANAQLVIEITRGRDDAVPIAVVPFGQAIAQQAPAEDISAIVRNNLHRSGLFKPLPVSDMLSRPVTSAQIIWRDFRTLRQEYLVTGEVTALGKDKYRVTYGLYDVAQGKQLSMESYEPETRQLRDVAHRISDRIFEQLTGIPGVFSTRILYVTFQREADFPYQLQYADADGHRVQTILRSKEPILSPSWSPEGRRIAYVSFEGDGLPKIFVHELATSRRRVVSREVGINGAPAWSPDGERLALTLSRDGAPEIYILDLASGELVRQTQNRSIDTEPRWLPDGQSLVFTSGRGGGPQIYRLDLSDGTTRRLTFEGGYNARPDITPDGRYMVFVHRRHGKYNIGVQDLHRGTFNVITETELDESPSVAPNGTMVIYGTKADGKGVLRAVSIDGRVQVNLPAKDGEVREPAWSPY